MSNDKSPPLAGSGGLTKLGQPRPTRRALEDSVYLKAYL